MTTQRTQIPWKLWNGYGPLPDGRYAVARIGPLIGGLLGADDHDIIGTKDALEHVVLAVNNFEPLLEAVRQAEVIAALAEFPSDELLAAGVRIAALGPLLRAAIAAVEGRNT